MMRKVREKIMSAIVVLCMILACTNSIVAEEVTISGFVEQLDIADEMTLSNYFQIEQRIFTEIPWSLVGLRKNNSNEF